MAEEITSTTTTTTTTTAAPKTEKVYGLDAFLDMYPLDRAGRMHYTMHWGKPYVERTAAEWQKLTGLAAIEG